MNVVAGAWPSSGPNPDTLGPEPKENFHGVLFSSGRAGLEFAVKSLGLTRSHIVEIPKFSSHCVLSSVGKIASPTTIKTSNPNATLVYEQWGWPFSEDGVKELFSPSSRLPVIIDSVDTVFDSEASLSGLSIEKCFRVWSLGKTLGVMGAGLVTQHGEFLTPPVGGSGRGNWANIVQELKLIGIDPVNFFRSNSDVPSADALELANSKKILPALEAEKQARRRNLSLLWESLGPLLEWPMWMLLAMEHAAPVLAPVALGLAQGEQDAVIDMLSEQVGVEARSYHFNISGNPLRERYVPVVALPLHREVSEQQLEEACSIIFQALT